VLYEADDNPLDCDAAFRLEIVCGSIAHEKAQGGDEEGYIRLVFNKICT